jgi:hypothetical protein
VCVCVGGGDAGDATQVQAAIAHHLAEDEDAANEQVARLLAADVLRPGARFQPPHATRDPPFHMRPWFPLALRSWQSRATITSTSSTTRPVPCTALHLRAAASNPPARVCLPDRAALPVLSHRVTLSYTATSHRTPPESSGSERGGKVRHRRHRHRKDPHPIASAAPTATSAEVHPSPMPTALAR